jgi:tetratricopeptide (TPR) repeat protein
MFTRCCGRSWERMRDLSPTAEQAWRSLRRHLERSERFTLVFLLSADPPALDEVRRRLEAALQFRASRLEIVAIEASAEWVAQLEGALAPDEDRIRMRSPVWLALDRHADDPAMNRQRDAVLASLNQQRTRLERSFRRPLLIALPQSYLPRIWEVAPDLWTIRGIVTELPAQVTPTSLPEPSPTPIRVAASDPDKLLPVAEWRRVATRASVEPELVSPFVAHAAVEAALENASLSEAMQIAEQELALARARAGDGGTDRQQDLAVALDDVGQVAQELGRLEAAEQAFAESLALLRRLVQAVGESPTALRELAVALNHVGQVARELGRLEAAEQAFAESLALRRRLGN